MINTEKDLEDYICNNQESFISSLKKLFGIEEENKFLGRQIQIGSRNIADLIYYFEESDGYEELNIKNKNYIIVELKNRILEPKDLGQLARYMNTLEYKIFDESCPFEATGYERVYGVLVGDDLDFNMQEIQIFLNNSRDLIGFVKTKTLLDYELPQYSYKDEYISELELDSRILEIHKKPNENQNETKSKPNKNQKEIKGIENE